MTLLVYLCPMVPLRTDDDDDDIELIAQLDWGSSAVNERLVFCVVL